MIYAHYKYLRFISKNAFVHMALWGDDYMMAAKKSYFLLKIRKQAEITKIDELQQFSVFQIKLCVSALSAAYVYVYLVFLDVTPTFEDLQNIYTPAIPAVVAGVINFFITSVSISNHFF